MGSVWGVTLPTIKKLCMATENFVFFLEFVLDPVYPYLLLKFSAGQGRAGQRRTGSEFFTGHDRFKGSLIECGLKNKVVVEGK